MRDGIFYRLDEFTVDEKKWMIDNDCVIYPVAGGGGGSGGGGGGGGGTNVNIIRYAPHIESAHNHLIWLVQLYRDSVIRNSPYAAWAGLPDADLAFFGVGFTISSFPALYAMHGRFMAGLDIRALYNEIYRDTLDGSVTNALVSAEAALLTDDLETNTIPAFLTGMRNINSVISSSFVTGKALLYDSRNKNVAKFSAQLKYSLIPIAVERWKSHLSWNTHVITVYDQIIKSYYEIKKGSEFANLEIRAKDRLWPFGILEYERAVIGALNGAAAAANPAEPSTLSRGISGAMAGAATGAMAGAAAGAGLGPKGALIGGILGLAGGLFS